LHQILGLRDFTVNGEQKKTHAFFEKGWGAPNIQEILQNPDAVLAGVPPEERFNLYFTVHHCANVVARDWTEQDVIPIDIDDVDEKESEAVADAVCAVLGLEPGKTALTRSGNGIQMFVLIEYPISDPGYFKAQKPLYSVLCELINLELSKRGLTGHSDPSVFSATRLMRMPNTINRKPMKGDKKAYVIRKTIEGQGWSLEKSVRVPGESGSMTKKEFKQYPPADTDAVLSGCDFLKHCKAKPDDLSEEQWYGMVGIIGHLGNGKKLAHDYSVGYHNYSEAETEAKVNRAIEAAGPRTCENINTLWNGCKGCKHHNTRLRSPIMLKGEDFIATEGTGLWHVLINDRGKESRTPAFKDISKYWVKKKGPITTGPGDSLFTYNKAEHVWSETESRYVKSFIYNKMDPHPRSSQVDEAYKVMTLQNAADPNFFDRNEGFVNMQNGVYQIDNGEILPHDKKYGFKNKVNYSYDEKATCPKFEKFLAEIFLGDQTSIDFIQEYMGYIVSGDSCWVHKAAIFYGEGRNGKSTLNEVIEGMVGSDNTSHISMKKISKPESYYSVADKLVNLADENGNDSLADSETFKSAVSGGDVEVKKLYSQPYTVKNKAKFIFNCNSLPYSRDKSAGLYRRLIILSFEAEFDDENGTVDKHINKKLLAELPGIFNFAMEGYRRLKKNESFTEPKTAKENMAIFTDAQNDVEDWFSDHIVIGEGGNLRSRDAYQSYTRYCDDLGKRDKMPSTSFFKKISVLLKKEKCTSTKKRLEGSRNPVSCYENVRVKEVGAF